MSTHLFLSRMCNVVREDDDDDDDDITPVEEQLASCALPVCTPDKTASPTSQIPTVVMGYLMKQGHFVKNWKKRFFVVERGVLRYYEKEQENHPYGINLKG